MRTNRKITRAHLAVASVLKYCGIFLFILIILLAVQKSYAELQADINNDGVVNFKDFAVLANEWLNDSNDTFPKPKYEVTFPSLSLVRNSIAYDANFRQLPENVARYEDICIASRPTVWINTAVSRFTHDIDDNLIICSDYTPVYATTDGVNFTKLFDISTHEDFIGYYEPNDHVRGIKVMADGSWLLSFGCVNLCGPGERGHLFRSVDKGLSWTHALEYERGFTHNWGWCATSDNEIAGGEYGWLYQENNPRRVYYSDDYGATWSKIWDPPPEPRLHIHIVAFPPNRTDILYVSSGDFEAANRVIKLEYTPGEGGKRNIANWSEAANSPILPRDNCPTCALSDGKYLYLGHDSHISPVILRLDTNDDSFISVLNWPRYITDSNHPYQTNSCHGQIFSMLIHDGVYYAAVRSIDEGHTMGGIYVSVDGEHWTCAYRVEGVNGFHNITGFANGYLWGTFYDNERRIYKMSPLRAKVVKAMCVERGITNQLVTLESSSFEGGAGGWGPRTAVEDLNEALTGVSTDMAVHGTSSYKIVVEDKNEPSSATICSGFCPVSPALGDYICASFWVRAAPTKPTGYFGLARIEAVGGGEVDMLEGRFSVMPNQGWEQKTVWARCTNDNFTNGIRLRIGLYPLFYGGDYDDISCYIDCAQIVYFSDLHYSGSWQIGGEPRANEVATGSLVGLGPEFTTTFEWKPLFSSREWHGNMPIATWTDGQEHIDLYYDHSNSKFVATDGTNTAMTAQTFSWEHPDSIKFAFTNMAGDFRLSVQSPLNGLEHVLTDNGNTMLGSPIAITFGTDSLQTNYGHGLIADIKHFDSALTVSEIQQLFDLVEFPGM